jgi:hypothetical protein
MFLFFLKVLKSFDAMIQDLESLVFYFASLTSFR